MGLFIVSVKTKVPFGVSDDGIGASQAYIYNIIYIYMHRYTYTSRGEKSDLIRVFFGSCEGIVSDMEFCCESRSRR